MVAPTMTRAAGRRRRSPLLAVWMLFGLVAAGVVVLDRTGTRTPPDVAPAPPAPARLTTVSIDGIGAVEIVGAGAYRRFERGADGAWFEHRHVHGADSGAAHEHESDPRASDAIGRGIAAFLDTPVVEDLGRVADPDAYGLAPPALFVALYRPGVDTPLARWLVGGETPDGARYVSAAGTGVVSAVPEDRIAALRAVFEGAQP